MTKKEMLNICVQDQIDRGLIPAESKQKVIRGYLKGCGCVEAITKAELQRWIDRIEARA